MEIKVVDLNLWEGGRILDGALDFLAQENGDLVLLQEVYGSQDNTLERRLRSTEILKNKLDYAYSYYSPAFIDVRQEGEIPIGNLILSKFEIGLRETIFFDIPFGKRQNRGLKDFPFTPRNLQHVIVNVNKKPIDIFNTQGIWGTDGHDNDRRMLMGQTIANSIKGKKTVILSGDFNVSPDTRTIGFIENRLVNIFKNELSTSFNMKRKSDPGYGTAVVDMMFVTANLKVKDHRCPRIDISDHLPLVATLDTG